MKEYGKKEKKNRIYVIYIHHGDPGGIKEYRIILEEK